VGPCRISRGRHIPDRGNIRQCVHRAEDLRNGLGGEKMCIAATHDYDGQIPDKDGGAADAVDGNCDGLCGAKQSVLVLDKDR